MGSSDKGYNWNYLGTVAYDPAIPTQGFVEPIVCKLADDGLISLMRTEGHQPMYQAHSSDGGLFGYEEEKEIIPAIKAAQERGIFASGPVPADTLFSKAKGGWYDVCVAMYHDQGHIPLKVVGFTWNEEKQKWDSVSGVNITLGLPIIRASVDHGTAFGKAGKGTATPESLIHAIEYAVQLATHH